MTEATTIKVNRQVDSIKSTIFTCFLRVIPSVHPSKKILLQTSQVRLDRYVLDSGGGNPPEASCYADVFNTTYSLNNRFTEKPNNFTVFRSHNVGYFRLYLSSGSDSPRNPGKNQKLPPLNPYQQQPHFLPRRHTKALSSSQQATISNPNMYIPSLASCLLLALANANGSLASTYSNSTLASLVGTTANAQANTDSCFDTITCNIDNDEDETGSVKYYDGFLSPDESKRYVDTIEKKSAEHPAAYNHIKVGASLGNRMKQLLIPSYTPTSNDNDNDNDDIMLQTRSIYESTHRHVDHYTPDHKGIRKVVEERVAFVFLTNNKSAKFNAGGKSIPAVAGRLVTFRGNIVHGTTIKKKGGHVHLLGPFAVKTFADVGDPCTFCAGGIPPENQGISITTSIGGMLVECGAAPNSGLCGSTTSTGCSPDCADGTGAAAQTCCPVVTTTTYEYAIKC